MMIEVSAPTPSAEGTLDRTPFGHVLLYVNNQGLSGTLVVWPDDPVAADGAKRKEDRIRLDRGTPVAARFADDVSALDRGILALFARRRAPYAFYDGHDLVGGSEEVRTGSVDVWALLAAAARGAMPDDVADAVLARVGDQVLRLRTDARLARFGLLPPEQGFVDLLRADPSTVVDLVASAGLPERKVRRLVYLLVVTKCVDTLDEKPRAAPGTGSARVDGAPHKPTRPDATPLQALPDEAARTAGRGDPPGGVTPPTAAPAPTRTPTETAAPRVRLAPEPPPIAPDSLTQEEHTLWADIATRALGFDDQNYFDMLGLSRDAPGEAARDAYFALAKRLHPDRLPPALAPLLPYAQRVFRHLTDAHETLADDDSRMKYIAIVRDGGGTPAADRKMANILEATVEFQKAEVLMRRRDHAGARKHIEAALLMNPDEADYHAMLARVLFEQYEGADAPLAQMLDEVNQAVLLAPKHDRAHYVRGLVLRRMGKEADAIRDFEKAAEMNPKNVEAQREVRLLRMRKKSGAAEGEKKDDGPKKKGDLGELFGNLFKKK